MRVRLTGGGVPCSLISTFGSIGDTYSSVSGRNFGIGSSSASTLISCVCAWNVTRCDITYSVTEHAVGVVRYHPLHTVLLLPRMYSACIFMWAFRDCELAKVASHLEHWYILLPTWGDVFRRDGFTAVFFPSSAPPVHWWVSSDTSLKKILLHFAQW